MSADRFFTIKFPLKYGRNKTTTFMICKIVAVWLISFFITCPLVFIALSNSYRMYNSKTRKCQLNHPNFQLYGSIFAFYIPFIIITVTYSFTMKSLKKLMRTKQAHIKTSFSNAEMDDNNSINSLANSLRKIFSKRQDNTNTNNNNNYICSEYYTQDKNSVAYNHSSLNNNSRNSYTKRANSTRSNSLLNKRIATSIQKSKSHTILDKTTDASKTEPMHISLFDIGKCAESNNFLSIFRTNLTMCLHDKTTNASINGDVVAKSMDLSTKKESMKYLNIHNTNNNKDFFRHSYSPLPSLAEFYSAKMSYKTKSTSNHFNHKSPNAPLENKGSRLSNNNNMKHQQQRYSLSSNLSSFICETDNNSNLFDNYDHRSRYFFKKPLSKLNNFKPMINSESKSIKTTISKSQETQHSLQNNQNKDENKIGQLVALKARTASSSSDYILRNSSLFSGSNIATKYSNLRMCNKTNNERKALRVLIIIFALFACFWTPFFLVNIIDVFCVELCASFITPNLILVITWLGYVSSMLNPVVYTMFNKSFREAFINLLKCQTKKKNIYNRRNQKFLVYKNVHYNENSKISKFV
jgi:hypothetical protein